MRSLIGQFCSTLVLLCMAGAAVGDGHCEASAPTANSVRNLTLPHLEPNLPFAPGGGEFMRACLSCHSARYVTMQPPFSRRQWEDTVRKMITAYGAPVNEFQVIKITDYLYAINGNGPRPPSHDSSSDDDDIGGTPSAVPPEVTERAPALEFATNPQDREADVRRGAEIFKQNCAGCHGDGGRGNGVISEVLLPKPADLTAARFSTEFLRETLWNGVHGTAMSSWRSLAPLDLSALVARVQSFHSTTNSDTVAPESLARGAAVFANNCLPCHGPTGDGKGPAAASLVPSPSNFKRIQPDFDYIQRVLRDGVPGTAMPIWKDQLSESDRTAVAGHVRSFYESAK